MRFISNASSGRMGLCLADSAYAMGYDVHLISTVKIEERPYNVTYVNTAEEMFKEVCKSFSDADFLIMAAAVSDYRVKNPALQKISKEKNGDTINIELVQNPDILKEMGKIKKESQKIIGFSLSTENILETAKAKLEAKKADFIIANEAKVALNTDENEVWIIDKAKNIIHISKNTKQNVAKAILERVL